MAADPSPRPPVWLAVAAPVIAPALVTGVGLVAGRAVQSDVTLLLYLLAVVLVALRLGERPSLATAALSVLAYDFFFVPPRFTLAVADGRALVPFAVFLFVGSAMARLVAAARRAREAEVAVEAEQLKARILASVSHDLRTPLAVIVGAAETLTGPVAEDARLVRELAGSIGGEADRLARLVTNLLALTRLEAGTLTLARDAIPVEEALAPALARVEGRAGGALRVHVHVPKGLPLLDVDPVLVDQLLENLLENVRRHAPGGASLTAEPAGPDRCAITVADRGPGVPEDRVATLFEPLSRASAGAGGLGLGLSICRGIARAHGGDLVYTPRPGGGSRFVVTLPTTAPVVPEEP